MAMGILCFILPVDRKNGVSLLAWDDAKKAPWDIVLLFGGGFAIAAGFEHSGLTEWIGGHLGGLRGVPIPIIIAAIALLMTFLTEATSNTSTTTMMLPVLAATAGALNVNPLLLMLPATICASCAFMLPVATPPNAIVFGSGMITIPQMAKAGLVMNILGIVLLSLVALFLAPQILG